MRPSDVLMTRIPKHRRSRSRSRSHKGLQCRAESHETGIVHYFDVDEIMKLANLYVHSHAAQLKVDISKNASLWLRLKQGVTPALNYREWDAPVYRILYGGFDPLSIAGSLKDGGRFNIGGPQFINDKKLFPGLASRGCLYAAESQQCARLEAGSPLGKAEEYSLLPQKKFQLWNLSDIIVQLDIPGLLEQVKAIPMSAAWSAQKSPLASQLLAAYLRDIGGDGVIFPSTKDPNSNIMAFFFKDDQESHVAFKSEPIKDISKGETK